MPVKKVPGGYMIVPRRVGPGGRDKPQAFGSRVAEEVVEGGGTGEGFEMVLLEDGGGGGGGEAAPPTNGGGAPPGSPGLPGPGQLKPGAGVISHPGTITPGAIDELGDEHGATPMDISASRGKVGSGKAGVTTKAARARALRPPPPPPRRKP